MRSRRRLVPIMMLSAASFVLVAFPRPAFASGTVTKGDVEAILNAGASAGSPLYFHNKPVPGFDDYSRASILPYDQGGNVRHFCVDDWHVIHISWLSGVDNSFIFTKDQAIAELTGTYVAIALDGVPQPVTRSPIRQMDAAASPIPGLSSVVLFQAGNILAPPALSVGTHTATVFVSDPIFDPIIGVFESSQTFIVDPSGTGSCLQPLP